MDGPDTHPSDETLRTLLDIAPDAIAIVRGLKVLYMSPSGARMLGFERPTDVIGMSLGKWLAASDLDVARQRMDEVIETRRPPEAPREYRVRGDDGRNLILEVASVPIVYEGEPSVLAFVRDVTERKALERQVADSARLAALGRLSAGVAHELNNPLTHLVLAIDGLRRQLGRAQAADATAQLAQTREKLELIAQDIDRMVVIARELRLFASPQPGARRAVDLRQPMEAAMRAVRETHPAAARVRIERCYQDVPPADADPIRVEQVFVNLLTNAFDSLDEQAGAFPCVTVELVARGESVAIQVRDEGPGIPDDMLERVFEPFFTTKAYGRGAGLGLAISRSIVQAMDGSLDVASECGRGTTFTITLPAWQAGEDAPVRTPPAPRRLRVLVIDDEAAIGRALAASLEDHDVVTSISAEGALDCIAGDSSFDVILCDVVMPETSGVEFHRALAATCPRLARRVVFMTGATLGSDQGRSLAALPNPVLEKPFEIGRLVRALEEAADSSR